MARIKGLIPPRFMRFADDYEVYVDHGKGRRPVKMNENEATFIDVENFFTRFNNQSKMVVDKKFNGVLERYTANHQRHSDTHAWTAAKQHSVPHNSVHHSTLTPYYFEPDLSPSTFRTGSKVIHNETRVSTKAYNTPIAASIDHIHEKGGLKTAQLSSEHGLSLAVTYYGSKEPIPRERVHPKRTEKKIYLNIAVNGASKSMRGRIPLSNLTLKNGDFGDDAGMFTENGDFCFLGLADGVSGNQLLGINPADFSYAILAACHNVFHQNQIPAHQLSRLLQSAVQQVQAKEIRGSSTLCLLALDKQEHRLRTLNIGDSGFVIYRENKLYHRSTCTMDIDGAGPRQLFALDNSFSLPCFRDEKEILDNCSLDSIPVRKNDIIILSSDGLWDVLKGTELQKIIQNNVNHHLQNLADDLLNHAVDGYAVNNRDDILIIVCRVEES